MFGYIILTHSLYDYLVVSSFYETSTENDNMSLTIQWITLSVAIVAALMPIIVEYISGIFNKKYSLYERRSQHIIRVYEDVLISGFNWIKLFATKSDTGSAMIEFTSKIYVANLHATTESVEILMKIADQMQYMSKMSDEARKDHNTLRGCIATMLILLQGLSWNAK